MFALCQKRTNALQQKYVATRRPVNWLCLVQIDDLDPIAIGVVKIGVPAGERGMALVGIFDEFDATRLHDCERPIEADARLFVSSQLEQRAAAVVPGKRELGVRSQRALEADNGVREAPESEKDISLVVVREPVARRERDCPLDRRLQGDR